MLSSHISHLHFLRFILIGYVGFGGVGMVICNSLDIRFKVRIVEIEMIIFKSHLKSLI